MATTQDFVGNRTARSTNGPRDGVRVEEGRSSDEIRDDIDRTRSEMDTTFERLGEQLKPRRLFESFMHAMGSSGDGGQMSDYAQVAGRIGKKAIHQAERHPIPALLFGAGLAWLMYEEFGRDRDDRDAGFERLSYRGPRNREWRDGDRDYDRNYDPDSYDSGYDRYYDDRRAANERRQEPSLAAKVGEKISDAAGAIKDTAQSVVTKAKDAGEKAASLASGASEGAADTMDDAREAARAAARDVSRTARRTGQRVARSAKSMARGSRRLATHAGHRAEAMGSTVGHQAQKTYQRGREGFEQAVEDYPLAVGVGFAALGVLAGLAIPSTQYEDEWMGDTSDRVKQAAKDKGEEVLERGKQTVESAVSTLKDEAKVQGLMPADLQEKAKHILADVADSAKEAVNSEGGVDSLKDKAQRIVEKVGSQVQEDAKRHKDDLVAEAKKDVKDALPKPPAPKNLGAN